MPTYRLKPPSALSVSVGVQNHPGQVRTENQDRVSSAKTPFGDLYLLADGVGGQRKGAEAAQYVVDAFVRYIAESKQSNPVLALKEAAQRINADLTHGIAAAESFAGMSSTVVLALIQGRHAIIAHVGDSRAYLLRGANLQQLTRDHSVMERLVSEHHLRPEEAKVHPEAGVLTQALGQTQDVELETLEFDLMPGDCLLLCSDGLWAYASHEEMQTIVTSASLAPQAVAEALLNLALNNGGGDNISLQFLHFGPDVATLSASQTSKRLKPILFFGASAILAVTAASLAVSNLRHPVPTPVASAQPAVPLSNPQPVPSSPAPTSKGQPPERNVHRAQIVLLSFPHLKPARWQEKMKSLGSVDVTEQNGDNSCAYLLRTSAKLYYTDSAAQDAKQIQTSLKIPTSAMETVPADQLSSCTPSVIVAVPGDASSPVQDIQHQAGEVKREIEKHAPVNGVPNLPSPLPIPKL